LMLSLSSLSRRSLYIGVAWVGVWIISTSVGGVLNGIHRAALFQETWREEQKAVETDSKTPPSENAYFDPDDPPQQQSTQNRGRRSNNWSEIQNRTNQKMAAAAASDWRPLCSYTANLQRLGEALLDTDSAWVEIGRAIEAPRATMGSFFGHGNSAPIDDRRLADRLVPQYPWIWSAGVLVGLLGLSIWILSTRVKSLDRLK
jgi:ABC-2 type transport system permease protein